MLKAETETRLTDSVLLIPMSDAKGRKRLHCAARKGMQCNKGVECSRRKREIGDRNRSIEERNIMPNGSKCRWMDV